MTPTSAGFGEFRANVDSWIKDINVKVNGFSSIKNILAENTDNIEHNYELIYELKDQIEDLKMEIQKLKLLQLMTIKKAMPELKH